MKKIERGTVTWHTLAVLHRIVDGDTFEFWVDLGFEVKRKITIRHQKYNAPETFRPRNEAERLHGEQAKKLGYQLLKNTEVELVSYRRAYKKGAYCRYLAYIILPDGNEYGEVMTAAGMAKKKTY